MKNQKTKQPTANQQAKALQNTLTRLDLVLKLIEIAKQGLVVLILITFAVLMAQKGGQIQGLEWGEVKIEFQEPISVGGQQMKE